MPDRKLRRAEVTEEGPTVSFRTGMRTEVPGAGKGTRAAVALEQFREERLRKKEDKPDPRIGPALPLKKGGGQMEIGWVRAWEDDLRSLLEKHPDHFRALHALVEGRGEEVTKTLRHDLRKWEYLLRDGSLHPDVQAVMTAAYRETPDGPCLVDPLAVTTPENAGSVQRFDEQREERRRQGVELLLQRVLKEGRGQSEGQSR
jgi:hypothetical protein